MRYRLIYAVEKEIEDAQGEIHDVAVTAVFQPDASGPWMRAADGRKIIRDIANRLYTLGHTEASMAVKDFSEVLFPQLFDKPAGELPF